MLHKYCGQGTVELFYWPMWIVRSLALGLARIFSASFENQCNLQWTTDGRIVPFLSHFFLTFNLHLLLCNVMLKVSYKFHQDTGFKRCSQCTYSTDGKTLQVLVFLFSLLVSTKSRTQWLVVGGCLCQLNGLGLIRIELV